MTTTDAPIVRLRSPGEIAAAVPLLVGFAPQDSLVVVALRGKRIGLTMRVDLPEPPDAPDLLDELAAELVQRVRHAGGTACAVVVLADARQEALVDALLGACADVAVEVIEALHVAAGRWSSYTCSARCCPTAGTPVPQPSARLQAETALRGRAVLPSRADLVASLAPPRDTRAARQRQEHAAEDLADQVLRDGLPAARVDVLAAWRAALDDVEDGGALDGARAAALAVSLHDVVLRDEVAVLALARGPALRAALEQVCRQVVPPDDAPACALLAWVAYVDGDGGAANVALDRARTSDPGHGLAGLLRSALDAAVPPSELRGVLAALSAPASEDARRPAARRAPPPGRRR